MSIRETEETHAAATKRLAELNADYARAKQTADDAQKTADTLLHTAAAGEPVTTASILKARNSAATARDAEGIAEAVRSAGQRRVDEAEAALLHAVAEALKADEAALLVEACDAAAEVDRAVAAAQGALASLVAIEERFSALRSKVHEGAARTAASERTNSVLKGLHASAHPKFRPADQIGIRGVSQIEVALHRTTGNGQAAIVRASVASVLGLAAPDPAVKAAFDLQTKLRSIGCAELDAISAGAAQAEAERQALSGPAPIQRGVIFQ